MAKPVDKKKMACNKPRRTPSHPKKSHIVKACENGMANPRKANLLV
jgi:hypothetical protein